MALITLLLQLLILVSSVSTWMHYYDFYGGSVTFTPKGQNSDGTYALEIRDKQNNFYCTNNYYSCSSGNCGVQTQRTITTISHGFHWCHQEVVEKRNLNENQPFEITYPNHYEYWWGRGYWYPNTRDGRTQWTMKAHMDLGIRSDTGESNRPPSISNVPPMRISQNCPRKYNLVVFDHDNDQVRCRFGISSASECTLCYQPEGFSLNQKTCTLSYTYTTLPGHSAAFEFMVEDFSREHIRLNYSNGYHTFKYPLVGRSKREATSNVTTAAAATITSGPTTTTTTTTTTSETTTATAATTTTPTPTITTTHTTTTTPAPTTTTTHTTTTPADTTTTTHTTTTPADTTTTTQTTTTPADTTTTTQTTTTPADTTATTHTTTTPAPTTATTHTTTTPAPTTATTHTTTTPAPTTAATQTTTTTPAPTTAATQTTTTTPADTTTTHTTTTPADTTITHTTTTPADTTTTHTITTTAGTTTTTHTTTTPANTTTTTHTTTTPVDTITTTTPADTTTTTNTTTTPTPTTTSTNTTTTPTLTTTTTHTTTTPVDTITTTTPTATTTTTHTTTTTAPTTTTHITTTTPIPTTTTTHTTTTTPEPITSHYQPSIAPLSQLPLQLFIYVDPHHAPSCIEGDYFPIFLAPTPRHGVNLPAFVNHTLEIKVRATAKYTSISDLIISGPSGTAKHRTSNEEYTINWTPTENEVNDHFTFCFFYEATDQHNRVYQSELRCVVADVGHHDAIISCNQTTMKVEVEKSYLIKRYEGNLHLKGHSDPACSLEKYSNRTHLVAYMSLNSCGTTLEEDGDNLIFKNEITSADPDRVISRQHNVEIAFSCVFLKRTNLTLGFRHKNPYAFIEKGFGAFTFQFEFYESQRFRTQVNASSYPIEVNLKQTIFMQIEATTSIPNTELFVESCRATPYDNPNSRVTYTIIENGCVMDDTVQVYPSSRTVFRFGMEAFEFIGAYAEVYITCSVMLCDINIPGTRCSQGCIRSNSGGRSKREAAAQTSSRSISQGPLHLVRTPDRKAFGPGLNLTMNLTLMGTCLLACVLVIFKSRRSRSTYQLLPLSDTS